MNKVNPCRLYVKIDGGELRIITGFRTELDCIKIWFRNDKSEVFSLERVEIFEKTTN